MQDENPNEKESVAFTITIVVSCLVVIASFAAIWYSANLDNFPIATTEQNQ